MLNFKLTGHWPQNLLTGEFVNPDTNEVYLNWLAEGNVPLPADTGTVLPTITPKDPLWEAIKQERERRKAGGVKLVIKGADKWFHSDAESRIQHLGLKDNARDVLAAGGNMNSNIMIMGQKVPWKTMDGSYVILTCQIVFDIVKAVGELDAKAHGNAEMHRAAMLKRANPHAYDFSTGWTQTFEESR